MPTPCRLYFVILDVFRLIPIVILLVLTSLCMQVKAQPYYNNSIYDFDGRADWMNSIIPSGNGYMALGWTANPGNVDKGIMFIDSSGNLTDWKVFYNQSFAEEAKQLVRIDSNRIAIATWYRDNITWDRQYKLELVDNSGNTIWIRTHGDSTVNEGAQALTYSNGRIVITGNRMVNGDQDVYIVAWDTAGNFLWDRAIGSPTTHENSYTIVPTDDGGYMVGGYKIYVNQRKDWFYAKVDSLGEEKWQRSIGFLGRDGCRAIIPVNVDNYLMLGYKQTGLSSDKPEYSGQIVMVDSYGIVLWDKLYTGPDRILLFYSGVALHDGSVVIVGSGEFDSNGKDYVYLLKVDSSGNQIWSRVIYYSSTVNQYLRDIVQTPDGGFLMVGSVLVSPNDAWVVKVDSMGCLEPGCDTLGTGMPLPVSITDFAVYPNPTTGPLVLDVPIDKMKGLLEIHVYASTGQLVWQENLPEGQMRHQFDFSGLPAGLYLAVLRSGGQITGQSRFVKQ